MENHTTITVELLGVPDPSLPLGEVREVYVPEGELTGDIDIDLYHIWRYGQNDFQPSKTTRSVSVGDIIHYEFNGVKSKYIACIFGYKEIGEGEYVDYRRFMTDETIDIEKKLIKTLKNGNNIKVQEPSFRKRHHPPTKT